MSTTLESARHDWELGYQELRRAGADRVTADRLEAQVLAVTTELRRRVGGIFTLDELASAYLTAEAWARVAIEERAATPDWPLTVTVATDAAFHLYARGAQDYAP
ncbi:MAG: hypothetical protein ACKVUT_12060 [Gaiella sp.]